MEKQRRLPLDRHSGHAVKATAEQIITAYRETGSVWAAAKRLGMCGQSVWERLRALDYPIAGQNWTEDEEQEVTRLAGECTIGEIATRLGRPYAGVASKISALGVGTRYGNRQQRKKAPNGYAAPRVQKLIAQLEHSGRSIRAFCREQSLDLELFISAIQRVDPTYWANYTRRTSDLTPKICPNCRETFYPLTKKAVACSRRCSDLLRTDRAYYGGKRQQTIGLKEGVCQLCMEVKAHLSSHHLLGKANDPDNEHLIALCNGCHQLVTMLGGRLFVEDVQGWENLINLVLSRRLAAKNRDGQTQYVGVHTCVDLEWLTVQDLESSGDIERAS
jgi:hypothetical protein